MSRLLTLLTVACGLLPSLTAHGQDAEELVRMLPRDANAIVVVKVDEILTTDRAVQENWKEHQSQKFLSGESSVPPWVDVLVTGSLVRPAIPEAAWSAALAVVPRDTDLATASGNMDAEPEYLGRSPAVRGVGDALFLEVRSGLLGVLSPGYRQDAGRWSRQIAAGGEPEISSFLQEASQQPGHILMAMDLQDMFDPQRVRSRLSSDESLAKEPSTRIRLATQLLRIRGIEMAVTIGETIESAVTISFEDDLTRHPEAFQKIFLDILADMGVGIDEFDTAEAIVEGSKLVLRTPLSEESLRRVMTLVIPPPPARHVAEATTEPPATTEPTTTKPRPKSIPASTPREASRQYLLAVNGILDDLMRANKRAKTYSRTATWHDNFARKINHLSTVGVDKDLVAYGTWVAEKLRAVAASLRGEEIDVSAEEGKVTYSYSTYSPWWSLNPWGGVNYGWGGVNVDSNIDQVRSQQAEIVAQGRDERVEIWQMIIDERAATETKMRQRYGDDFLDKRKR